MATRLWLPSSGGAPVSPAFSSTWNVTTGADRLLADTSHYNTAFVTKASAADTSVTNDNKILVRQYVSPPLNGAQTITGTLKGQVRVIESNAAANAIANVIVRVVSNDGTTVRGTLYAGDTRTTNVDEVGTTLANRKVPGTSISPVTLTSVGALNGDRIVIELGFKFINTVTTSYTASMSFGDNAGVASDLAEDITTTAANNPWVEFSQTISLHPAMGTLTDDFSTDLSKWPESYNSSVVSGKGVVSVAAGYGALNTGHSAPYDFVNTYGFVAMTTPTSGTNAVSEVTLGDGTDGGNNAMFEWQAGTLTMHIRVGYGDLDTNVTLAVAAGDTIWCGYAEGTGASAYGGTGTPGSLYWYTSTDGLTWTLRKTYVGTPAWLRTPTISLGAHCDAGTVTATFDNFNVAPTSGTAKALVGAAALTFTASGTPTRGRAEAGTAAVTVAATATLRRTKAETGSAAETIAASATLTRRKAEAGTLAATVALTAAPKRTRAAAGTVAATFAVSGTLSRVKAASGITALTVATTGAPTRPRRLTAAAAAATFTASATPSRERAFGGTSAATFADAGTIRRAKAASATSAAVFTLTATAARTKLETGSVALTIAAAGDGQRVRTVTATASVTVSVSGSISRTTTLTGTVAISTATSATPQRPRLLTAASAVQTALTGTSRAVYAERGQADVRFTTSLDIGGSKAESGRSDVRFGVAAAPVLVSRTLTGSVSVQLSTGSALAQRRRSASGTATLTVTAAATPARVRQLTGTSSLVTTARADLAGTTALAGTVSVAFVALADLRRGRGLTATVTVRTATSGAAIRRRAARGSVAVQTTVSGRLFTGGRQNHGWSNSSTIRSSRTGAAIASPRTISTVDESITAAHLAGGRTHAELVASGTVSTPRRDT